MKLLPQMTISYISVIKVFQINFLLILEFWLSSCCHLSVVQCFLFSQQSEEFLLTVNSCVRHMFNLFSTSTDRFKVVFNTTQLWQAELIHSISRAQLQAIWTPKSKLNVRGKSYFIIYFRNEYSMCLWLF